MASYSRQLLSGSTNGKPIPVAATATPGTQIHQALAGLAGISPQVDEIYLLASNVTAAAVTLTIEFGGTTDPADHICKGVSIPANSPPIPIVTGQILNNSLNVKAFASSANAINITGYVNRIS